MKKIFYMLIVGLFLSSYLYSAAGVNGAEFLTINSDAKSAGMAGIGFANNYGTLNVEANPANINYLYLKKYDVNRLITFSHNELLYDTKGEFLQYVQTLGEGGIGLYFKSVSINDITETSNQGESKGFFSSNFSSLALIYGNQIFGLKYGVTLKSISEKIYTESGQTLGLDFGLIHSLTDSIDIGFSVLNIGQGLKIGDSNEDPLPMLINLGASYLLNDKIILLSSLSKENNMNLNANAGGEYYLNDFFILRTGFKFFGDSTLEKAFSLGFSFMYGNLTIDYAYVPFDNFGDNHKLTLSFLIGN